MKEPILSTKDPINVLLFSEKGVFLPDKWHEAKLKEDVRNGMTYNNRLKKLAKPLKDLQN